MYCKSMMVAVISCLDRFLEMHQIKGDQYYKEVGTLKYDLRCPANTNDFRKIERTRICVFF